MFIPESRVSSAENNQRSEKIILYTSISINKYLYIK